MPRVAVVQFRPYKGQYTENLQKVGSVFTQVAGLDPHPDILAFPETTTSGYFVEGGVRDVAVSAGTLLQDLRLQHERSGAQPLDVMLGFYEEYQNHY